ncbi:MAG: hypothetical protein HC836_44600 [Richelia sp. RM2_1_2]|nr:hypothetical protein [Richelia sp. RM2_1_2]
MAMKYICFDNGLFDEIVVFSSNNDHNEFRNKLGINIDDVISAGFISVNGGELHCYGVSVSLKKKSRPDIDTKLVKKYFAQ